MRCDELLLVLQGEEGLVERCKGVQGKSVLSRPCSLDHPLRHGVAFSEHLTPEILLKVAKAGVAILITSRFDYPVPEGLFVVEVTDPRLGFALVTTCLAHTALGGIDPTAVVDPSASIHPSAHVGALCYVGPECFVGAGSVLHPRSTLVQKVTVGENCVIHSGAVLGAEGFSYARREDDTLVKIKHFGCVILENDVDVGPNTNVNQGTLDATRLRSGTKIDAMCHIGHNADVGPFVCVAAGTSLARSRIGRASWMGIQSCIVPGNNMGDYSTLGAGGLAVRNVEEGTTVAGVPAKVMDRKRGKMW